MCTLDCWSCPFLHLDIFVKARNKIICEKNSQVVWNAGSICARKSKYAKYLLI